MTITAILSIIILHYVFDFVLQTHKMASMKSKCLYALSSHVGVYAIGVILMSLFQGLSFQNMIYWVLFNIKSHFITDYHTSKMSSKLFNVNWHNFFVVIGLDQAIHYTTLIGSVFLMKNLQ